jgi:hypothetical protein
MPKMVDITGQRFGRLIAMKRVGTQWGKVLWLFQCDYGNETTITSNVVRMGNTSSCGCFRRDFLSASPLPVLYRPSRTIKIEDYVPAVMHHNPFVNEAMRRMTQLRWQRVEFESRQIERGIWKEPKHIPFVPLDECGNVIPKLDLRALARAKNACAQPRVSQSSKSFVTYLRATTPAPRWPTGYASSATKSGRGLAVSRVAGMQPVGASWRILNIVPSAAFTLDSISMAVRGQPASRGLWKRK